MMVETYATVLLQVGSRSQHHQTLRKYIHSLAKPCVSNSVASLGMCYLRERFNTHEPPMCVFDSIVPHELLNGLL